MGPYKNYFNRPRTLAHNCFNKAMSRLQIEVRYGFTLHQNLWTWNGFHLGLKLCQDAAICYAVSVFLANIWTCIRGNQTSLQFACMPSAIEEYLALPVIAPGSSLGESELEKDDEESDGEDERENVWGANDELERGNKESTLDYAEG